MKDDRKLPADSEMQTAVERAKDPTAPQGPAG